MDPLYLSLIRAVTDDDTEAVRALLAAGSDVNRPTSAGHTPLMLAVLFRRTKILSLLLEAGADPELRDALGLNAVDWAQRKGFAEGVKLLSQHKTTKHEAQLNTPVTKSEIPDSPIAHHVNKQNSASTGSTQIARADEKSRRWIAGLRQRIDEANHNVKEVQPSSESETAVPKEPAPIVVNDNPPSAPPTEAKPEAIGSLPDSMTNNAPEMAQLQNQIPFSETKAPIVPSDEVARSQLHSSTIGTTSTSSSRKRCPECNATYNSELLAYCAVDMTPLIYADAPVVRSSRDRTSVPLVWSLVVCTLVIAAAVTYLVLYNSKGQPDNTHATLPKHAANIKELPLVAGGLSGKEVNVPAPEYPASARSERVSGSVTVRVRVNKAGSVIAVKVVEGDQRLRNAAIAAAQKATFSPEKLIGQEAVGTITYTFKE